MGKAELLAKLNGEDMEFWPLKKFSVDRPRINEVPHPPFRDSNDLDLSTEKLSAKWFDILVGNSGLFKITREVTGEYIAIRPNREVKRPRIDRILVATEYGKSIGLPADPMGVELKAYSKWDTGLAKSLSQLIDYSWAKFPVNGQITHLEYLFLWPFDKQTGGLASIADQNRIAFMMPYRNHFRIQSSNSNVLYKYPYGYFLDWKANFSKFKTFGRKTGSR